MSLRTPLGLLNLLVPKDQASRRVAAGISYGSDARQKFDLYAPKRAAGPLPIMIFVYGGGWNSGDRTEFAFAGRAFAALGFLTLVPDHRIVPEVHYPAFVEDVATVANWALAHGGEYGGDPGRFALSGHSAGAYSAVMLGLEPERFGAPALKGRVRGIVGLSGPYDFYPFDVKESIDAFARAGAPETTQPVNLVTPAAPPMFLVHGARDRIVGPYHTVRLAAKLRENGVRVEERSYPWMAHPEPVLSLMRPLRGLSSLYPDMAAFLREVMQAAA